MEYKIVAVKIGKREADASGVQKVLTDFGCNIKVRLGLHDMPANSCSPSGLILLEVAADDKQIADFTAALNAFESVTAKNMTI